MKKLQRREFLKRCAGAAAGLGAARLIGGCGNGDNNEPADTRTPVAAARGNDLSAITRQALDRLGGIDKIVRPGETVFIKPNFVSAPFAGPQFNPVTTGECTKPDVAVVDFSIGLEADGPNVGPDLGKTVDMSERLGSYLVLASTDLLAADATAARIMSHDPNEVYQLTMGRDMGLGVIDPPSIRMEGDRLEDLIMEWEPAKPTNRKSAASIYPGFPK